MPAGRKQDDLLREGEIVPPEIDDLKAAGTRLDDGAGALGKAPVERRRRIARVELRGLEFARTAATTAVTRRIEVTGHADVAGGE